jgi:hypothetical protein
MARRKEIKEEEVEQPDERENPNVIVDHCIIKE